MIRKPVFPSLQQTRPQQWSQESQTSQDSGISADKNVLEDPTGPVEFQLHGRHRDQRMRIEDQDFDPDRYGMLWESKDYDDFPGHANFPRGESSMQHGNRARWFTEYLYHPGM